MTQKMTDRLKMERARMEFPATFGLRAFRDEFTINLDNSFISAGTINFAIEQVAMPKGTSFCNATAAEIRSQIIKLKY